MEAFGLHPRTRTFGPLLPFKVACVSQRTIRKTGHSPTVTTTKPGRTSTSTVIPSETFTLCRHLSDKPHYGSSNFVPSAPNHSVRAMAFCAPRKTFDYGDAQADREQQGSGMMLRLTRNIPETRCLHLCV